MPRKPMTPDTEVLRKKADKVLAEKQGNARLLPADNDPAVLNEFSAHKAELEAQNEELRKSTKKLEELQALFFDLYETAPVGYMTFDEKGVILRMNLTASRLLDIEKASLLKKPFSPLVTSESQDAFYLHRQYVLRSQKKHTCELQVWRGKKEEFFHAQLESVAASADGKMVIRSVLTDITERKQMEEERKRANEELERKVAQRTAELAQANRELRMEIAQRKNAEAAIAQSEAKFSRAFYGSASAFAIATLDEERFVEVNESFLQVSGHTRDEVIGHTPSELGMWSDPEQQVRLRTILKEQGHIRRQEVPYRLRSGKVGYALVSASVIDIDGKECILSESVDITDRKQMEEELRLSQEKFEKAFMRSPAAVMITSLDDGRVIEINEAALKTMGFGRDEIVGTSIPASLWVRRPEDRGQWVEELRERRSIPSRERTVLRRSGELGSILISAELLTMAGEEVVLSTWADITDRKRAEQALRESEERLRTLNEAVFEGLAISEQGRIVDANDQFALILGLDRAELIGMTIKEFVHEEDRERVMENVRSGRESNVEHRMVRRDGKVITVEAHGKSVTEGGHQRRFTALRDITERKQMEEELRRSRDEMELRVRERTAELQQSQERFQTLVDLLPEAVFEVDLKGRCTYANRQALQYTGRTFEELDRGLNLRDIIAETDRHRAEENVRKILGGEVWPRGDYTIRRKDGSEFPAFIRASRIERNGETVGVRGIMIDITAPRRAEAERARLEEQLHQAVKMQAIGTLAGGIAHDFNNMLAVIIGNAELALDDEDLDSIRGNLDQILSASKRSRDLVRQILTFGRKREGQRRALKLIPLIEETTTLLRGSLPSTVYIKTDIRTESDTIIGDTSQIQQVLMNLATNAVHAMAQEGTLTIRLSEKKSLKGQQLPDQDLQPGRYLKLTLRDTGTGIPADVQKRMFDPFFTTKEPGQGTGMGLAVVYGIVKSHGGVITVSSKTGKGTIFSIFLPAATESVREESITQSHLPRGTERVLVVDDEASVVAAVSETMKRLGYKVTTALSGADAWKKFAQNPSRFDLVITDHVMPEITGLRLSERILGLRPDLPIILSTGYSETVSAEDAVSAGVREFLMKPIERRTLADVVRRVLDAR